MDKKQITGIILAGGKSRRMGQEKGLIRFGGRHLIEHSIKLLEEVCDDIIISENTDAYNFLGYKVIPDIYKNSGPMGGIYSALKHSKTEINLVLSCDMPFISIRLLRALIEKAADKDVVVPWHGKEIYEPMCALYHKNVIPVFEEFIEKKNFKLPDAYKFLEVEKVLMSEAFDFYKPYLFKNLNTVDELVEAEQIWEQTLQVWNNLLLIAGTGRNVGKTTLACKLIKQHSKEQKVIGIKISPHIHDQNKDARLLHNHAHFSIYQELNKGDQKDSSRMLKAGADEVFYIQAQERFIGDAFALLAHQLQKNIPIVCESGGLRNFIKPSLFLICRNENNPGQQKYQPMLKKADDILRFDQNTNQFNTDISSINFKGGVWKIA